MPSWWCTACLLGWDAESRIPCWGCGSLDPVVVAIVVTVWRVA